MSRVLHVIRAWGPVTEAPVLVMREGFSPRYDLDRLTGVISRIGHSAEGESIKGRIRAALRAAGRSSTCCTRRLRQQASYSASSIR